MFITSIFFCAGAGNGGIPLENRQEKLSKYLEKAELQARRVANCQVTKPRYRATRPPSIPQLQSLCARVGERVRGSALKMLDN